MRLITIALLFVTSGLVAQTMTWGLPIRGTEHKEGYVDMKREVPYDQIQGSPYENEKLIQGIILMSNNDTLSRFMRLNLYTNEMEYVEGGQIKAILNPLSINRIFLNDQVYRYARYLDLWGNKKEGYLTELVSGDCQLYQKNSVKFKEAGKPKNSYEKPRPQTFLLEQPQFIGSCSGTALKVLPSKSKLDIFFGDRSDEALGYIKKNKIKVKKSDDLVKLFTFLNGG